MNFRIKLAVNFKKDNQIIITLNCERNQDTYKENPQPHLNGDQGCFADKSILKKI